MTRQTAYVIVFAAALQLAACRQPDGPMPPMTDETANELGDISRDMLNVASANPDGPKDLMDDVSDYAQGTSGEAPARELARRIGDALKGKTFTAEQAMPVAHSCWVTVAGRQLSEKQVETLQNEMKSELMTIGVNEQQAQSIADQVKVVQEAVTARHRRWYELL